MTSKVQGPKSAEWGRDKWSGGVVEWWSHGVWEEWEEWETSDEAAPNAFGAALARRRVRANEILFSASREHGGRFWENVKSPGAHLRNFSIFLQSIEMQLIKMQLG